MRYRSTKTYGHDVGLSCCFRQWRADHSHCQYLHGYALAVHLEFEAAELDERNWVVDFGGLKEIKAWLQARFDHTLVVAQNDPAMEAFAALAAAGAAQIIILPAVGCEAFAAYIGSHIQSWLLARYGERVRLVRCEVREHGANSAALVYEGVR